MMRHSNSIKDAVNGVAIAYVSLLIMGIGRGVCADASLDTVAEQVESLRLDEADATWKRVSEKTKHTPRGLYIQGRLQFYRGNYAQASSLLKQAIERQKTRIQWKYLNDQAEISLDFQNRCVTGEDLDGVFTVYYESDTDGVLVPYAVDTLHRQNDRLSDYFDDDIRHLNVYILSSVASLSDLSGLSIEQIKASGTVAITKYNRLMILSPRLVDGGYPWLDTLAHELTHVYITRVSRNRTPMWLHEGIAKMAERWWWDGENNHLTPELGYLLDRAAREGRLIPFSRFDPSVALLPSQEDAALAYAQALSFVRFVEKRISGDNGLAKLLRVMAQGTDADAALKQLSRQTFSRMRRWWKEELLGTRQTASELVPLMKIKYAAGQIDTRTPLASLVSDDVRRHVRVGDLLLARGHMDAARKEFQWALEKNGVLVPAIADRLAGTLMELGEFDTAVDVLDTAVRFYPYHSTAFVQMGKTQRSLGNTTVAVDYLKRAIALDPFDTELHCMLAQDYERLGMSHLAAIEQRACIALGSGLPHSSEGDR